MRKHNRKRNIWGRRITAMLLLCGLLLPITPQTNAASVTYEYKRIIDVTGLPTDGQWHDYFIAWEDLDDKNKVWFTNYHWYTSDGDNNIDEGGTHWMEYKAASTLPDSTSASFASNECLGHMQIKYAGKDEDNGDSPKYYIRVSKMNGGYSYFTKYEPTDKEKSADAFTFQDNGDVFHIFVNIGGKADRYLTRDGQYLETTESSSLGASPKFRNLRVYQRTYTVEQTDTVGDVVGKVNQYEYFWINSVDELMALTKTNEWTNILLAWEDANGSGTSNPDKVWYTKETWYDDSKPNYRNDNTEFLYWSNDTLGSDGYGSAYAESFILPSHAGHFQMKFVGWDKSEPVYGVKDSNNSEIASPVFQIRFDVGREKYFYLGNDHFEENPKDASDYTVQLRLGENKTDDPYGSVHVFRNVGIFDEYLTRVNNRFDISNWETSKKWEFSFRIYTYREVQCDAVVKSFTIGKGATYSVDSQLIVNEGVTITVEDGGILTVDDRLLNNGNIVVKNGGTVIVNEGGYIMAYDQNAEGKITLDGGNLIIMDNAKVICDQNGGTLQADHGSTILNRGLLMVGNALMLNRNSYLKNESNAMLLVGGKISQERGGIGALSFSEVASRVTNGSFKYICSGGSKIVNRGIINEPGNQQIIANADLKTKIKHIDGGRVDTR